MNNCYAIRPVVFVCLLTLLAACGAAEQSALEGTWSMTSYFKADNQTRYQTDGYMMFGKAHWLHVMFLNRDERQQDFAEAHHGTYEITGPGTLNMSVDMELHMDPKSEMQDSPVWYGPPASLQDAHFSVERDKAIIDLPSGAQLVLQRVE